MSRFLSQHTASDKHGTHFVFRLWRLALASMLLLIAVLLPVTVAKAQDTAILAQGDAVVTGFSGINPLDRRVPAGASPLDTFFIDIDGPSMQIRRLGAMEGRPQSQLIAAPALLKVTAGDVGQVFAIAFDDARPPNIYLGATSAFGIQIVVPDTDGSARRIKTGQPNADWMPGQFGTAKGGGPGSIYKVDSRTGAVTLFATIPGNTGPGLGDIVYDRRTRHFYVSDLDSGLVYRLNANGIVIDTFDHGVSGRPARGLPSVADDGAVMNIKSPAFDAENPDTWGYTSYERMVWGLAVRAGRLYYAAGSQVWSVGFRADGGFAGDVRWEFDVAGLEGGGLVSDLAFDGEGRLYLGQRGRVRGSYDYSVFAEPKHSAALRYRREPAAPDIWVADEYAIGMPPQHRNASGGIALGYGYDANGRIRRGACDAMLWSTGDSLRSSVTQSLQPVSAGQPDIADVHGLQGNSRDLLWPQNAPPIASYFIDYDGQFADPEKAGHVGDVEIWQPCEQEAALQPSPGSLEEGLELPATPPSDGCVGDQCRPARCEPGDDCCRDGSRPVNGQCSPPRERTNLKIWKGSRSKTCAVNGAGWRCFFQVIITNIGPGVYSGPIQFKDMGSIPNALVTPTGDFACVGSPADMTCTTTQSVLLAPNKFVIEDFVWQVDATDVQPGMCELHNQVKITAAPGGSNQNTDTADDQAAVTVALEKLIVGDMVYCAKPLTMTTNLKLEKKALGCTQSGAMWCSFVITVNNTGPGVYNDKFAIEDVLPAGFDAQQAQFSWPICLKTANKATCLHDAVQLNQGDSVSLTVQVPIPRLAMKICSVKNEAHILPVPGGPDANTNPNDDYDSATGQIPDCGGVIIDPGINRNPVSEPLTKCPSGWQWIGDRCGRRVVDLPPPTPGCREGMVPSDGHCCPAGSVWTGRSCGKKDNVRHCPVGTVGQYPNCRCPAGQTGTPPNCKRNVVKHCPEGTTLRGNACIKKHMPKPAKIERLPRLKTTWSPSRLHKATSSNRRVSR